MSMYNLRSRDDKLYLTRDGKEIAMFIDPKDLDTANTVCNVLEAEEQRWNQPEIARIKSKNPKTR